MSAPQSATMNTEGSDGFILDSHWSYQTIVQHFQRHRKQGKMDLVARGDARWDNGQ